MTMVQYNIKVREPPCSGFRPFVKRSDESGWLNHMSSESAFPNLLLLLGRVQLKPDGTREGKWRGNWRMEWVASTLHTTSEHGVSSITTADAHTSAASSRLNWRPRRFKWTRPFRRKTKSGSCACAITFQTQSTCSQFSSVIECVCLLSYFMERVSSSARFFVFMFPIRYTFLLFKFAYAVLRSAR